MSTLTMQPSPVRKRYGDYAEKLFDRPGSRTPSRGNRPAPGARPKLTAGPRKASRRGGKGASTVRSRSKASGRTRLRTYVLAVVAGVAAVLFVHGGVAQDVFEQQRPDPMNYRALVDLVSIDRVGTMFYGEVSQGFFLQPRDEQQRDLERLVKHVASEGYRSFYLAEASGRTVAWWNGRELQVTSPDRSGS